MAEFLGLLITVCFGIFTGLEGSMFPEAYLPRPGRINSRSMFGRVNDGSDIQNGVLFANAMKFLQEYKKSGSLNSESGPMSKSGNGNTSQWFSSKEQITSSITGNVESASSSFTTSTDIFTGSESPISTKQVTSSITENKNSFSSNSTKSIETFTQSQLSSSTKRDIFSSSTSNTETSTQTQLSKSTEKVFYSSSTPNNKTSTQSQLPSSTEQVSSSSSAPINETSNQSQLTSLTEQVLSSSSVTNTETSTQSQPPSSSKQFTSSISGKTKNESSSFPLSIEISTQSQLHSSTRNPTSDAAFTIKGSTGSSHFTELTNSVHLETISTNAISKLTTRSPEIANHDHHTISIIVSLSFMSIAVIAVAVLGTYIIRARRGTIQYDELRMMP